MKETKKIINITGIILLLVSLVFNMVQYYRLQQKDIVPVETSVEERTETVRIVKDGDVLYEVLSLSPDGWLDFIKTYPDENVTISNLPFEEIYSLTPVEGDWYGQEVAEFIKQDKSFFISWNNIKGTDLYCYDFIIDACEYRDGISFYFKNQKDNIDVCYTWLDAHNVKSIYLGDQEQYKSIYYTVFTDMKSNKVYAINNKAQLYELTAK